MALVENGRSMGRLMPTADADFDAIANFLKDAPASSVYDVKTEGQKIAAEDVPHVDDINTYASRIVEAEIAAKYPVPTIRRPLGARRLVSLIPTILG